jgi:hypothetical protein
MQISPPFLSLTTSTVPAQAVTRPRPRRFEVEPSARHEILRALAEILLIAAEAARRKETGDEAR